MKHFRCQQLGCDNSRVNDTSHPVLAFQIAQTDAAVASRQEVAHLVIYFMKEDTFAVALLCCHDGSRE